MQLCLSYSHLYWYLLIGTVSSHLYILLLLLFVSSLYFIPVYIVLYCNLGANWARSSLGMNKILFYRKTKCPIEDAVERVAADKETTAKLFHTV